MKYCTDHIVVDVEIQRSVEDLPGRWNDTHLMGVACAVVYEFNTDRFRLFGPNDVEALKARLRAAERISGFNIWNFDFPVIWAQPNRAVVEELRTKTTDILLRIWKELGLSSTQFTGAHKGWSLENVVKATLGVGKILNGAEAPKLFQAGEHMRLANYCVDDVTLERDLTVFIDRFGYVNNDEKKCKLKFDYPPAPPN